MFSQKLCQDCGQRHNCSEIYRQLGDSSAPSVAMEIVAAFLLPIICFIGSLVASENMLSKVIFQPGLRAIAGVLIALSATLVWILIVKKFIRKR